MSILPSFKQIRSLVGSLFPEKMQMRLVGLLSQVFWSFRKYFLGVQIDLDEEFLSNWNEVKSFSSIDRNRNRNIYQFIKLHNELFKGKNTNLIELGVDRGASLITIAKFTKSNSTFIGIDSFAKFANEIKTKSNSTFIGIDSFAKFANEIKTKSTSKIDTDYQRKYVNYIERFKNFEIEKLISKIENIIKGKESKLHLIQCHFPTSLSKNDLNFLENKKYSFAHIDFDLFKSTDDAINLIFTRLEKNGIVLFDDFNFINQDGVKRAVYKSNLIDKKKCIELETGQLLYINF